MDLFNKKEILIKKLEDYWYPYIQKQSNKQNKKIISKEKYESFVKKNEI